MLGSLAAAESITWISILVKALAYAATLLAGGSVLARIALRQTSEDGRASLRGTAIVAAVAAAVFSALRLPLRASFLMGGTWDGALDPMILSLVADSPLGTSVALRLIGLALILCVLLKAPVGQWLAALGAGLASASFALRGHALGDPQMILGALITIHILGLSYWVGAFAPLARSARFDPPARAGALAHEFGRQALWVVGLVVAAGGVSLALLGAATPKALTTAYGQMFLIKLIVFAGVLSLAAVNKLALTPALCAAVPGAGARLRRSIGLEAALVALILTITAALTTFSSPPSTHSGENAVSSAASQTLSRAQTHHKGKSGPA